MPVKKIDKDDDLSFGYRLRHELSQGNLNVLRASYFLKAGEGMLSKIVRGDESVSARMYLRVVMNISNLPGLAKAGKAEKVRGELLERLNRHVLLNAWQDEVTEFCRKVSREEPNFVHSQSTLAITEPRKIGIALPQATYGAALSDTRKYIRFMHNSDGMRARATLLERIRTSQKLGKPLSR